MTAYLHHIDTIHLRASITDDGRAVLDCLPELGASALADETANRANKIVFFIVVPLSAVAMFFDLLNLRSDVFCGGGMKVCFVLAVSDLC